jgi:hypothetical protein
LDSLLQFVDRMLPKTVEPLKDKKQVKFRWVVELIERHAEIVFTGSKPISKVNEYKSVQIAL